MHSSHLNGKINEENGRVHLDYGLSENPKKLKGKTSKHPYTGVS